ncbi:conjugative transposon protein TraM [Olivibacter jilunii]|uniref:conjugative transposon protein TraM n=1 Tax=Olivibacter jilunii TaxID=985016 RepID=UPI00102F68AA|nr:conjugative transposon protein TraM [Olivibacter jilunii]
MENVGYSEKFLRERKFMMVVPFLVLPFITMLFWVFGGGKGDVEQTAEVTQTGLNMQLPSAANPEDSTLDKMAFYSKADKDSLEHLRQVASDPYYKNMALGDSGLSTADANSAPGPEEKLYGASRPDANEAKIYERLNLLNKALNEPEAGSNEVPAKRTNRPDPAVEAKDIDRLENMMNAMQESGGEDPEMKQLSGMLERILDIQHPDRVRDKLRKNSAAMRGQVFAVSANPPEEAVSVLDSAGAVSFPHGNNGFYSLEAPLADSVESNAIRAVIHETQTLVTGATVKLRLLNDIYINGQLIPKDHFVYGIAGVSGERLTISIQSILYGNSIYPVNLIVYDLDGVGGLYIPGAITRDVAKESAERSMQSLGLSALDPSLGAQAMTAGIEATKSLLSKKVKLIKVTVKAGYAVVLKDENRKGEG